MQRAGLGAKTHRRRAQIIAMQRGCPCERDTLRPYTINDIEDSDGTLVLGSGAT